MTKKIIVLIIIISIVSFMIGCTATKSFEGSIENIKDNIFRVDCSSEINKGKIAVETVKHICSVYITEETIFTNSKNEKINIKDFSMESTIKVVLESRKNIKKDREITAKEIVLLKSGLTQSVD